MSTFMWGPKGYVNLANVEFARHVGSKSQIESNGNIVDGDSADFGQVLIQVIPCAGGWECLHSWEEDGTKKYAAEPIIAWGLTALGGVVPVTPVEMNGMFDNYALREVGQAKVFDVHGPYDTADNWLKGEHSKF